MKLIKTMLREWKVSLLVFALLFAQAACELALPGYTSRLVDVGVQQAGIERPSPERLSEDSYKTLLLFMTPEQQPLFVAAYQKEDGAYRLVTTDESELGKLDSLLIMPEALMLMMSSEEGQPLRAMLPLLQSGLMSAEDMQARTREFWRGKALSMKICWSKRQSNLCGRNTNALASALRTSRTAIYGAPAGSCWALPC